jgi:hypothetical protein
MELKVKIGGGIRTDTVAQGENCHRTYLKKLVARGGPICKANQDCAQLIHAKLTHTRSLSGLRIN